MGSREGVAAKIDAETQTRIAEMNSSIAVNKQKLIGELLDLVYDIKPQLHPNYQVQAKA
jgi:V-type H+-transporting ATPase subunit G